MEETVRFAKENGYVKTIMNRRRYIRKSRPEFHHRSFGERVALNTPIQGAPRTSSKSPWSMFFAGCKRKASGEAHFAGARRTIVEAPAGEAAVVRGILKRRNGKRRFLKSAS
jgi:DNA polymerase-1